MYRVVGMVERRYADGQTIFEAGAPADGAYRVRTGSVRAVEPAGDSAAPALVFGPGEVFGDAGFLIGDPRPFAAVAVGEVRVDYLPRASLLALLSSDAANLAPLIARQFGPFVPLADEVGAAAGEEAGEETVALGDGLRVRILPDGRRVRAIVGAEEVIVERVPFCIGRRALGEGMDTYRDVSLALDDTRPFNLSRRHFTIDSDDGALIVRDNGSYHGTLVNGLLLGGEGRAHSAPLMGGANDVVAGKADSPFRFRIVIG